MWMVVSFTGTFYQGVTIFLAILRTYPRNTGIGSIFDVRVDTNGQDVVGCSITDNSINGQLNDCTLYLDGSAVIYSNKIDGVVTNIHNHSSLMRCYIAEGVFLAKLHN